MNLEELNTQALASFYHWEKVFVLELESIKESNYWGPKKQPLCQTISFEIVSIDGNSPRI